MNVEEMEDYTQQPAFPNFVKLITPNGDGPFVLRVGGTYADSAYWNGEISQIMPQYIAPTVDRVTLNDAWLQSLAGVVSQTGSNVILNVNAADHDPQMALNLVEAAERILPPDSLSDGRDRQRAEPLLARLRRHQPEQRHVGEELQRGPLRHALLAVREPAEPPLRDR